MKKLTLKHASLCELVLCLPIILPAILILAIILFLSGNNVAPDSIYVILAIPVIAVGIAFIIWYTLHYGIYAISIELVVRAHKREKYDRRFFYSSRTQTSSRAVIEQIQGSLEKSHFKLQDTGKDSSDPAVFAAKKSFSLLKDRVERILLVYDTENLTKQTYNQMANDAKRRIGTLHYHKNSKSRMELVSAMAFCIVTDHIAEDIGEKAKDTITLSRGELFPCVYECSSGKVFLNGGKFGSLDDETYTQKMISKYILGCPDGKLPRKGNLNYCNDNGDLQSELGDKGLFEFIREMAKENKESQKRR